MRTLIKTHLLAILFLIAFTIQVEAQSRRSTKGKVVVVKTKTTTLNRRSTPRTRISSKKLVYKRPVKKVVSVRNVPNRTIVKYRGQNYYYSNNKYYIQSRGRYIAISPQVGFRINRLPLNSIKLIFNNRNYYNVEGIFYIQRNNEYEVVEPEIGTIIYELPSNYEKVTLNGKKYYEYANVLYEKVQVNGTRAYEVVGIVDME